MLVGFFGSRFSMFQVVLDSSLLTLNRLSIRSLTLVSSWLVDMLGPAAGDKRGRQRVPREGMGFGASDTLAGGANAVVRGVSLVGRKQYT